ATRLLDFKAYTPHTATKTSKACGCSLLRMAASNSLPPAPHWSRARCFSVFPFMGLLICLACSWLVGRWRVCSLRLSPGSGFPFLRGQPPCWGTVLDIFFRCAEGTRRRVRGRDA